MSQVSLVTVAELSPKGEGIAFDSGREIYIENVLLGEQVEVEVGDPFVAGSKRCPGTVLRIVKPSSDRCSSIECEYYGKCGGCALQHMTYEAQLRLKQADIKAAMEGVVATLKRPDLLSSDELDSLIKPTYECTSRPCRFKSIRYFATNPQTNVLELGFYASRTHDLVAIDSCPLEPESFASICAALLASCRTLGLQAHDAAATTSSTTASTASSTGSANSSKAILKAVQLRQCDEGVAVLLIASHALSDEQKRVLVATATELKLASFYVGINTQEGNSLYCNEVKLLAGAERLTKRIAGKDFYVGPQTFMQVNYDVCEQLYSAAVAHCASAVVDTTADAAAAPVNALDLCCGVGTMTLALSDHFEHVTGVEIVQSSIDAAKENAERNSITNVSFIASDLSKALPSLLTRDKLSSIKAVIADPARAGIGASNATLLAKLSAPCKVSMIFCSLKAVKRDLPPLLKGGFKIDYVQGFDMFPSSVHIETLVCLSKS